MRHNCIHQKRLISAGLPFDTSIVLSSDENIRMVLLVLKIQSVFHFSRCDRTFKSEYSWKRHQSNDEVHQKMENFTPFLTCEVIFNFISSFTLFFRFAGSSLRGGGGGAWISTCSAMRRRGSSTVTSVENSSGTPHI